MKMVIAVIQPPKLRSVQQALAKVGVTRMTVCDAQGYARQRGHAEMYRGREYASQLLRKIAVEILVNDDYLDRTIETLVQAARTGTEGHIGDGKILVLPAERCIQISDGVQGPGAV